MADGEAEAAFIRSMQVMGENGGSYPVAGEAIEHQIDTPSSDEYDPAQVVQDIPLPSGPQNLLSSSASVNDHSHGVLFAASSQSSPSINGITHTAYLNAQSFPQSRTPMDHLENTGMSKSNGISNIENSTEAPVALNPTTPSASAGSDLLHSIQGQSSFNGVSNSTNGDMPNSSAMPPTAGATEVDKSQPNIDEGTPKLQRKRSSDESIISPTSAVPKARLPHDRLGILEDRIKMDERGDMDAWLGLIAEHRSRGKLDEARKVFDRFFTIFPSAVSLLLAC